MKYLYGKAPHEYIELEKNSMLDIPPFTISDVDTVYIFILILLIIHDSSTLE